MENKQYLTLKQAASIAGVSYPTIFSWIRKGKIPTYTHPFNGRKYIDASELEKIPKRVNV